MLITFPFLLHLLPLLLQPLPRHRRRQHPVLWLDLLAAGRTFFVFKELELAAVFVFAADNEPRAAGFAFFLHKGPGAAYWAGDVKLPAAARAYHLALFDLTQTGRAQDGKRAV
jgi:hypothetical protein